MTFCGERVFADIIKDFDMKSCWTIQENPGESSAANVFIRDRQKQDDRDMEEKLMHAWL